MATAGPAPSGSRRLSIIAAARGATRSVRKVSPAGFARMLPPPCKGNSGDRIAGQRSPDSVCDLTCEKRRNGIPDLDVLLRSISLEDVVVRKSLQASRLTHGQAAALRGVRVNVVVPIL